MSKTKIAEWRPNRQSLASEITTLHYFYLTFQAEICQKQKLQNEVQSVNVWYLKSPLNQLSPKENPSLHKSPMMYIIGSVTRLGT